MSLIRSNSRVRCLQNHAGLFGTSIVAAMLASFQAADGQTVLLQPAVGVNQGPLTVNTPQITVVSPQPSAVHPQMIQRQVNPPQRVVQPQPTIQRSPGSHIPAQVVPQSNPNSKHLGPGPVQTQELSDEILSCPVCRQRLGLAPLPLNALPGSHSSSTISPSSTPSRNSSLLSDATKIGSTANPQPMALSTEIPGGIRMLGSPGLMSPGMAAQMATDGLIVEEYIPPQPQPGAIQLEGIPLEARQEFLRSLDLPFGARVMTANVAEASSSKNHNSNPSAEEPSPKSLPSNADSQSSPGAARSPSRSLGSPGIVTKPSENKDQTNTDASDQAPVAEEVSLSVNDKSEPKPREENAVLAAETPKRVQGFPLPIPETPETRSTDSNDTASSEQKKIDELNTQNSQLKQQLQESIQDRVKLAESQKILNDREVALAKEREQLAIKISQLDEQRRMSEEQLRKRIAQADAANKEVLALLEKRTAEVTELQARLSAQLSAINPSSDANPVDRNAKSKKKENKPTPKGKKPSKHPSTDDKLN